MNFIETAHAGAPAGAPAGDPMITWLFMGGFILIFYFLLIRPQNKRRKEHQQLMSGLNKGDEVVTAGGVVGVINKVEDDFVKVEVGDGVELRFQKTAIGATLPKGTLKGLEKN